MELRKKQTSSSPDIQQFYRTSKSGKKIVLVGDSTTEIAPAMYDRFNTLYTVSVGLLNGATVVNRGANGNTIQNFVANQTASGNGNGIETVIADKADLYILSYGINDIRAGARTVAQIKADIKTTIDRMLNETNAFVLLRIPNTFLNSDPGSTGWVVPLSSAQEYSNQLWEIYESFRGYNTRLDVIDIPNIVFGRITQPTHPLILNILHPNDFGYCCIADELTEHISGTKKSDISSFYDYEMIMRGWIQTPSTDISNTTLKFYTNSSKILQVNDIVMVGNSYSFIINQTPTLSNGFWTITHTHTGDFSHYGSVKILRKKS